MRVSWAARVAALPDPAPSWAAAAAALLLAGEKFAADASFPISPVPRSPPSSAARHCGQRRLTIWRGGCRPARGGCCRRVPIRVTCGRRRLAGGPGSSGMASALLASSGFAAEPVLGAAAVLAVDAWRLRAALEMAARGGQPARHLRRGGLRTSAEPTMRRAMTRRTPATRPGLRWPRMPRPVRMDRVALVAPSASLRDVLVRVAASGVVEIDTAGAAQAAQGEAGRRLQHARRRPEDARAGRDGPRPRRARAGGPLRPAGR